MIDVLRQTSEQYANRIAALETQISDAKANIKEWEKDLADVTAAKDHNDSKLPKLPKAPAAPQS